MTAQLLQTLSRREKFLRAANQATGCCSHSLRVHWLKVLPVVHLNSLVRVCQLRGTYKEVRGAMPTRDGRGPVPPTSLWTEHANAKVGSYLKGILGFHQEVYLRSHCPRWPEEGSTIVSRRVDNPRGPTSNIDNCSLFLAYVYRL